MPLTSEWELSAELKASLLTIPLGRPIPQETLEEVRYQVDVALEELAWLDDRRGLFNSERQLQTALVGLLEALSAMDKAPG
jgi:hypothetical protein